MKSKRRNISEEYRYSDDADVVEGFETVLLEMQARGIATEQYRTDRADGRTVVNVVIDDVWGYSECPPAVYPTT